MAQQTYKNIEAEVIKQSELLSKKIPGMLADTIFKGKFVAFYNDETIVGDSHEECFNKAEAKFGSNKGYVIDEITGQKLYVSALIKL